MGLAIWCGEGWEGDGRGRIWGGYEWIREGREKKDGNIERRGMGREGAGCVIISMRRQDEGVPCRVK